jgi:hypothetical protein
MTLATKSMFQSNHPLQADYEIEVVNNLVQVLNEAGVCQDRIMAVNLYVALKSKPLVLLVGPALSGKVAIIECLSRFLMGGECFQCQIMLGHAWNAEKSGNVALFIEAQTRLNTEKLLALIEEASRPENAQRIFTANLVQISPAELLSFFTDIAIQLQKAKISHIGDTNLKPPIPWPPNLFMSGTMDTTRFNWWDDHLLSKATIIHWPKHGTDPISCRSPRDTAPGYESRFLQSCIRNEREAYRRVHSIFKSQHQPLQPLFAVESILNKYNVFLPRSTVDEAIIYFANAWSRQGVGLFDRSITQNLAIALDLVIAQTLLPRVAESLLHSEEIRMEEFDVLEGHFSLSAGFLRSLR